LTSPSGDQPAAEAALTEAMITAAMAKADARVCVGSDRCYAFPDRLEDARETWTPKGRCKVGWIVSRGGRESWDVWLEVSTGLVKFNPTASAGIFTIPLCSPSLWHTSCELHE
jgi:hypothetical protein